MELLGVAPLQPGYRVPVFKFRALSSTSSTMRHVHTLYSSTATSAALCQRWRSSTSMQTQPLLPAHKITTLKTCKPMANTANTSSLFSHRTCLCRYSQLNRTNPLARTRYSPNGRKMDSRASKPPWLAGCWLSALSPLSTTPSPLPPPPET